MKRDTLLTWSWLNILTKKRYDALIQAYGSLDEALLRIGSEMLSGLGCKEETVMIALNRKDDFNPVAYQKELDKRGLQLVSIEDEEYPDGLQNIEDSPIFLYARGDLSIVQQPCLGIVGSRMMSSYGRRVTECMVPNFVDAGMVTVSGLAMGIDSHVANETLRVGGRHIAVMGYGLAKISPRISAEIAESIVQNGGLILSEFPLDAKGGKYTFPARNRIIAGLSVGVLVLEAGKGSGALITAALALDYNREVFIVPGQIFDSQYEGCHQFIASGRGKLVSSPEEVLQELNIIAPDAKSIIAYSPSSTEEEMLYATLTAMPQSVTDLVKKAKVEAAVLNGLLTMMELQGAVKNIGGGMWVRN